MKRFTLILGAAVLAAISAPVSAHAQSCSWWNLSCNGLVTRVVDNSWHIAGRDQAGNVVYVRRLVDSNGNVVFEQSHRNDLGRYLITGSHVIRRGNVYNAQGERCKYNESSHGYKEECKYARGYTPAGIRYPSSRFGATGTDCKYQSNEKGYKEECKYAKVKNTYKARSLTYKPAKYKPVKYEAAKIKPVKYQAAKIKPVKNETPNAHKGKDKAPKH
ncbi:MAG: hypothetical protein ACMG6H_14975 [Acidobacteriota bacterium]